MIIAILTVVGLCLGSFVNALVWRLREQEQKSGKPAYRKRLSITQGRSMCPDCHHDLAARDLVPVLSWLSLGGKCRHCHKPISSQYPLVELLTAGLFVASYLCWPVPFHGTQVVIFGLWLVLLTGLLALLVYDLRWMLLPNRIVYPLGAVAGLQAVVRVLSDDKPLHALLNVGLAVLVGGGIFYLLYQFSNGRWIGGGDVKLGWLLGLIVATPAQALAMIFIAALGGSLISVPLLALGRLKRTSVIPFGPFLIGAAIVVVLFGADILDWYQRTILQIH